MQLFIIKLQKRGEEYNYSVLFNCAKFGVKMEDIYLHILSEVVHHTQLDFYNISPPERKINAF